MSTNVRASKRAKNGSRKSISNLTKLRTVMRKMKALNRAQARVLSNLLWGL
jgi:hypothetical protein